MSTNLKRRIAAYYYKNHPNNPINHAMIKYGKDNFKIEILHFFDDKNVDILEVVALETAFIDFYKSLTEFGHGYNVCLIGRNFNLRVFSGEEKKRIYASRSGKNHKGFGKHLSKKIRNKISHSHEGKKLSIDTKNKISSSLKNTRLGEDNPFFGKTHSKKVRERISKANMGNKYNVGRIMPEHIKLKIKATCKSKLSNNNKDKRKSVKQIDKKTGQIIKIWDGIRIASKALNIEAGGIVKVCKGKAKTSGGFKWEYV